jgi:biotin carboxyl carrier protein
VAADRQHSAGRRQQADHFEARNFPEIADYYRERVISRGRALLRQALERGIESGEFRPLNVEAAIDVIIAPLLMLAISRFSLRLCGHEVSPETYLETHFELLLRGLRPARRPSVRRPPRGIAAASAAAARAAAARALAGCGRRSAARTTAAGTDTRPRRHRRRRTVSYSGEVRSRHETPLAFRIPGKITARPVDAGAIVTTGQVLARIDPADSLLSAEAANAQLELAAADVQRWRHLRAQNFVSQAALDGKESAYRAARAQAELARNQSAYTVLRADQAGVIGLITGEVGQVVAAGQTVMRLARADTLEVAISIPEARMPEVRSPSAPPRSRLWADGAGALSGRRCAKCRRWPTR